MRTLFKFFIVALLLAPISLFAQPNLGLRSQKEKRVKIPNEYIVTLKAGEDPTAVAATHGMKIKHIFKHAFNGFHGTLNDAQKAKLETRAKHPTRDELRPQLELLRERWPHLRRRLSEHLLPSSELAQMLAAAGAPNRPEQIGISPAHMRQSFRQAYHIRRRFTVLDVAVRTGTLDACLDDVFL